jgi:hypothetical protein
MQLIINSNALCLDSVQVSEIDSQMDAAPQRVVFLRAEPAVVSLISSAIVAVLGLQLTGIKV